jgi:hypothetical protein
LCFANCQVKSISIPRSIQVLGKSLFCDSTVGVVAFEHESLLETIDEECFRRC